MGFGASLWQELVAGLPGNVELARILVRLGVAMALGCFLGMERAHAGKAAGMRTHMLVTLGAALVVMLPQLAGMSSADASRVIQGTLTGIGFIGGGVILKMNDQHQIVGITTASSIWLTATVGIAAGTGRLGLAVVSALLAFIILTLFGRFEHRLIATHAAQQPAGGRPAEMRPDRVL
jgi:putative Mg2+ transporter-C (MgtC) family protein